MTGNHPHVSILILNWNGGRDTVECLETVLKNDYDNFNIIVVDNKSDDNSLATISGWAGDSGREIPTLFPDLVLPLVERPVHLWTFRKEKAGDLEPRLRESLPASLPVKSVLVVANHENSGFAAGNNLAVEIARILFRSTYYFILNNDTVIENHAVSELVNVMEEYPAIGAATSAVYSYHNRAQVANLGGRLTSYGDRKYYTRSTNERTNRVTFVTGCALMVRDRTFRDHGTLSERFFFGEEDFDFSWRMKVRKVQMVCVQGSRVYHKKGVAAEKLLGEKLGNAFLFFFNRMIDMKQHFSHIRWHIWRHMFLAYVFIWLAKRHVPRSAALRFIRRLHRFSGKYDDAKKHTLDEIFSVTSAD
jgi:hypothetical protein